MSYSLANFGGQLDQFSEIRFINNQRTGNFDYDANYLDSNVLVKNLKYSTIELTERIYVDKPIRMQKDLPIEKK